MSDLENIKEALKLYNIGVIVPLNQLRLLNEDVIDHLEKEVNDIIGRRYSENDIIIEAKLNNMLVEARELYTTIIDLINK